MLLDAKNIEPGTTLETDICIAGAGAAGITLARELAAESKDVMLLEGGGLGREQDSQDLYRGTAEPPLADAYLHGSRLRFLGGTTNHWLGYCRPLDPIDFQARPWVEHSGWPFGPEALAPYYERAASVFGIDPSFDGAEALVAEQPGVIRTVPFRVEALRFGPAFRPELKAAASLKLVLHANALRLGLDPTGRRVKHLEAAPAPGRSFRIRARRFVLALGGIENARRLLLSNDVQPNGIGNEHDLVGRYFMDHPVFPIGQICALGSGGPFTTPSDPKAPRGIFRLTDDEQAARKILNASLSIGLVPQVDDTRHQLLTDGAWGDLEALLDGRHLPSGDVPSSQSLHFRRFDIRPEPLPNPQNRVTLGDTLDAFGQPLPHLRWQLGQLEVDTALRSFEVLAHEAGAAGLARLRIDPDVLAGAAYSPGFHHMGATRMHDDPRQGVVNAQCQVHGVDNLYLAGSSVFPTAGYANPTFTLVALALRLADHLRQS